MSMINHLQKQFIFGPYTPQIGPHGPKRLKKDHAGRHQRRGEVTPPVALARERARVAGTTPQAGRADDHPYR